MTKAVTYSKKFVQSQCSWAEDKANKEQPQEFVTEEL